MRRKISSRLTFANVMSAAAFFLALTTGGAYATHEVILSSDILDGEVKKPDVDDGAVGTEEVLNETLTASDIKPDSLGPGRILDNTLTGGDIRDNTLMGVDILESSLGKVPSAAKADDSAALGGQKPSEFAPANPAATLDIPDGETKTLLTLSGLGDLNVLRCETTSPVDFAYGWDNTSSTNQDVWHDFFDADDTPPPQYGLLSPTDTESFQLRGPGAKNVIVDTIRIRPVSEERFAVTIHFFAAIDANGCRASAQAVLSK